jgi:hypothetical protein
MIRPQERIKRFSVEYHTLYNKVNKTDSISYNAIRAWIEKTAGATDGFLALAPSVRLAEKTIYSYVYFF